MNRIFFPELVLLLAVVLVQVAACFILFFSGNYHYDLLSSTTCFTFLFLVLVTRRQEKILLNDRDLCASCRNPFAGESGLKIHHLDYCPPCALQVAGRLTLYYAIHTLLFMMLAGIFSFILLSDFRMEVSSVESAGLLVLSILVFIALVVYSLRRMIQLRKVRVS